jgi:hypothetical protein
MTTIGSTLAPVNGKPPAVDVGLAVILVGSTVGFPVVELDVVELDDVELVVEVELVEVDVGETVGVPVVVVDVGDVDGEVLGEPLPLPPPPWTRTLVETLPTLVPSTVTSAELEYDARLESVTFVRYRIRNTSSAVAGPNVTVNEPAAHVEPSTRFAPNGVNFVARPFASKALPAI